MYFAIKTILSGLIIATVSFISKKSPLFAGIIVSLPIVSILAIIWLYIDTKNSQQVINLSNSICLMILPSITFFIALTFLLKKNINFYISLTTSVVIMILFYSIYTYILSKNGINL